MGHHGLESFAFLVQLQFELRNDLHLDSGLSRALVVQDVFGGQVLEEGRHVDTMRFAAGPFAGPVTEQGVLFKRGFFAVFTGGNIALNE